MNLMTNVALSIILSIQTVLLITVAVLALVILSHIARNLALKDSPAKESKDDFLGSALKKYPLRRHNELKEYEKENPPAANWGTPKG